MTVVRDILLRPDISRVVTVLCDAGHHREVAGVALIEDMRTIARTRHGQAGICTGRASGEIIPDLLDVAVRFAAAANVAVLALVGPPLDRPLPLTVGRLAERCELSLLAVERDADLAQLTIAIEQEIARGPMRVISRAAAALAALERAEPGPDPIGELAALAGRELGLPVAVAPGLGGRGAPGPDGDGAPGSEGVGAHGPGGEGAPVTVSGAVLARLRCAPAGDAADAVVRLVLHRAASLAGHAIEQARRTSEGPAASRAALLAELLLSAPEDAGPLLARTRRAGFVVDGWHTVIHIELDNLDGLTGGDESARHELTVEARRLALQSALNDGAGWQRADAGSALTLVRTDRAEPAAAQPKAVARTAAAVLARLKEQFAGLRLYCGVGGSYPGLEGLQTSATEARAGGAAARTARHQDRPLAFRDLGFRRVLLQWYAMNSSRVVVDRLLAPLDELGPRRRDEALRTLQAFLDHPGSPRDAAAALGVHRNTVANRVKRLLDLLDVDGNNADHRLLLQLACRVAAQSDRPVRVR
ncbi:PucR family transcriptional regulator [Nonomuraea typhae]|uniref:PucR family transcriptional regulator n=1 Tax=Nonomuraea typhae TaxID=2603600 RepID=UPI0015E1FDF2|nr:helix-turn-helix domain-containing protein [Nonomuraea typhae]